MDLLLDIFDTLPDEIMLTSSYLAFRFSLFDILITDEMIVFLSNLRSSRTKEDETTRLIDKILEFRSKAVITIE